jgi:hypothetical protein
MRKVLRSVRPKKGPGHNARPHDCTMFRSTAAMNVSVERKWVGPGPFVFALAESFLIREWPDTERDGGVAAPV